MACSIWIFGSAFSSILESKRAMRYFHALVKGFAMRTALLGDNYRQKFCPPHGRRASSALILAASGLRISVSSRAPSTKPAQPQPHRGSSWPRPQGRPKRGEPPWLAPACEQPRKYLLAPPPPPRKITKAGL